MAGSLRDVKGRPGTWELRIYLGRDSNGRVRHQHVTFKGSRRQAERELARLVATQDAKPAAVPEEPARFGPTFTVNNAIEAWRDNGWDDLSPKTVRGYESTWRVHIKDTIGPRRVGSLSTYDVERYYRTLKAGGQSAATVRQVKALLHRSLRLAHKWSGGTLPNPAADAELPNWGLDERPAAVRAPDIGEIVVLLQAADERSDVRFSTFLRLLAATGMRRGEACGLRWSDLDLTAATAHVDEAVVTAMGGAVVKGPKTRASIRTVALDSSTVDRLQALQVAQDELAAACGTPLTTESFVFSFEPGGATPPYPDTMTHTLTRLRERAGVARDIHLHSLRHFHATAVDSVVSEAQKQARLGWSTVQMARHYTDGVPEEDRLAAEHVGRILGLAIAVAVADVGAAGSS